MRTVIVTDEVRPEDCGICIGVPELSGADAAVSQWTKLIEGNDIEEFARTVFGVGILPTLLQAIFGKSRAERLYDEFPRIAHKIYQQGYADGKSSRMLRSEHIKEVYGAIVSTSEAEHPVRRMPFEERCITLLAKRVGGRPTDIPSSCAILQGAFQSDAQLDKALTADGGSSRIHVIARSTARQVFRRHGGGVLEEGTFVIHPKRENTLVPLRTFHLDMLQEMTGEVRVVMGRIGARTLEIETIEGVTFSGAVVSKLPAQAGGASAERESSSERRLVYKWATPTYEPAAALDDCVWIRDNAGAMTIVEQRRTSDLVHYEEFSKVDTSFRVAVDVMQVLRGSFEWQSESTYRYKVEFFARH